MTLDQYLCAEKLTYEEFAELLDYSRSAVGKWARRERVPRPDQMRRIYAVTKGLVSANDFVLTPALEPEAEPQPEPMS